MIKAIITRTVATVMAVAITLGATAFYASQAEASVVISDSAQFDITLVIEPTVKVTAESEKLTMVEGFTESDICVESTTRSYDLTMTDSAVLTGTSGDTVQMAVWYEDLNQGYESMSQNTPLTLSDSVFSCSAGQKTGKLVFQADDSALYADTYSASVTFTVSAK